MVNRSIQHALVQKGSKFKFWAYMYISAWIMHRIVVALFYHVIIPECRGGGCGLSDRLYSFLDPFGLFVLLIFVSYVFFLNLIFVRQYSTAFLILVGAAVGVVAIVFYPSDWNELVDSVLDMVSERDSMFGIALTVMAYPLLFGFIFLLLTLGYFIFHNYR